MFLKNFSDENNITFLNKEDFLCNNSRKECDFITPEGFKIYFDQTHYSIDGAKYLGKKIFDMNWFKID